MKSVSMAHGPLGLCVALCLLVCAPVATAQPPESDAVAPTPSADPTGSSSGGQQATEQEQTDADLDTDRMANETDPSALTEFRAALDPHGVWMQHPTWGLVWVPNSSVVGPEFVPYVTSGRWALSENGEWIWVSDFPFGWAVFHYGRWVSISAVGWAWIPGTRYAPAWVRWRVADPGYAYVGWGPLPPSWIWVNGAAVVVRPPPPTVYVFCPSFYVFHHRPYAYLVRDPVLAGHLGHHTRRYAPRYGPHGHRHSGPSMAQAHVPPDAVPRHRASSAGPDARHPIGERAVRRSRAPADPAPARARSGSSRTSDRTSSSVRSRRAHVAPDSRSTSDRAAASPTVPGAGRAGRSRSRINTGRTTSRSTRIHGPGRGFVPRGIRSTGARTWR
ncbi:MAG: hypothetical protein JW940_21440 [Polyangiaceae bacterium]|nr:hypothetical protein [Polyangiaceae bacterium]